MIHCCSFNLHGLDGGEFPYNLWHLDLSLCALLLIGPLFYCVVCSCQMLKPCVSCLHIPQRDFSNVLHIAAALLMIFISKYFRVFNHSVNEIFLPISIFRCLILGEAY